MSGFAALQVALGGQQRPAVPEPPCPLKRNRTREPRRRLRAQGLAHGVSGPWRFSARARVPRAARGGGALGSVQGQGVGGRGACGSGVGGRGGIPQRQARTVAATGATDKRVESQPQALRQRDRPSPKDRLEGGRRRESQRLSTSRARTPPLPSILRDGGRSAAPRRGRRAITLGPRIPGGGSKENVDDRGQ